MGFFDRFKKEKTEGPEDSLKIAVDTVGFILFDRLAVDIEKMEEIIKESFGEEALLETDRSHAPVIHLTIRLEGVEFWCSYMPFPVPKEEADIPSAVKWNFLKEEEAQAIKEHQSFFIAAQKGAGLTLERKRNACRQFSRLCGALMEMEEAVGLCRNTTGLLISKETYLRHTAILNGEAGQDENYFPAPLWIGVRMSESEGKPVIETFGLKEFGFLELRFFHPQTEPAEVFSQLYLLSIAEITGHALYQNMDMITLPNGETAILKQTKDILSVMGGK